jgi:hypothetical protein
MPHRYGTRTTLIINYQKLHAFFTLEIPSSNFIIIGDVNLCGHEQHHDSGFSRLEPESGITGVVVNLLIELTYVFDW